MVAILALQSAGMVSNLVIFGGAGTIFSSSAKWLKVVQNQQRNDFRRRVVKSMRPLRIYFGSNYVDNLTTLVIQHFCMIQTMNLLLLA